MRQHDGLAHGRTPSVERRIFLDPHGTPLDRRSLAYTNLWLRSPSRLPPPDLRFWYRDPGLWLPLSCAITLASRANTQTNVTATSVSSPSHAHTAGNLLVAVVQAQLHSNSVSGVANTAGDTWTPSPKTPFLNAAGTNSQLVYYTLATAGNGGDVVTVTLTGSGTYLTIAVYEFHADTGTWSFADDETGSSTSGTAIASGSVALTGTSVITAIYETDGGSTPTPGTGYTQAKQDDGGFIWDSYHITSSSETATATAAGSGNWGIIAAGFLASSGGGGFTALNRKTLSGIGSHVGGRRPHGWG